MQKQNYKTLFMFETDDLVAAQEFLTKNDVTIFTPIEGHDTVSFLTFKDPDRNVLMACQSPGA